MQEKSFKGVRIGTPEDEDKIYDFLLLLHAENALLSRDENKVRNTIRNGTNGTDGVIGLIEGKDGKIEASIGMFRSAFWYSDDPFLEEYWTFVRIDCRKSSHASNLMDFAKWVSDWTGLPLLSGIVTRKKLERKMQFMQRKVPQIGALFWYGGSVPPDLYKQKSIPEFVEKLPA